MDSKNSDKTYPVLSISNLTLGYRLARGVTRELHNLHLQIWPGEIVGLVGPSGSGKTSLAKAILGLLPETAELDGEIEVLSKRPLEKNPLLQNWKFIPGSDVAYLAQEPYSALNPALSIQSQFSLAIRDHHPRQSKSEVRSKILSALRSCGLTLTSSELSKYPHEFSGGELQRICLALALLHEPRLLIADEPTSALDRDNAHLVLDLIVEKVRELNSATLIVSHDLTMLRSKCDRIVRLSGGRVVELISEQTLNPPKSDFQPTRALSSVPLVQASNLGLSFIDTKFGAKSLFTGLDFKIYPGQTLAVTGPSGAGKTSLARLVVGLERSFTGSLSVLGSELERTGLTSQQRRKIAMIFQDSGMSLNPRLNVAELILDPLRSHGLAPSKLDGATLVRTLLARVGLAPDIANRYPRTLSGGQRQRVSIARSLVLSPELLVADEPTSSLDREAAESAMALISELQIEQGFGLLLITHDERLVEKFASNSIYLKPKASL
jgi:peptide/nickel transport system ATP-binding protein